jgi:DNA polymerase III epsilon subunit-like protein
MSLFVVDVEADGPCPGLYSMVSFGAVLVDARLATTYYGRTRPISGAAFIPEALAVSKITREDHLAFPSPAQVLPEFVRWVKNHTVDKPVFVSDNPAFDWQFINYYCHAFADGNPFGHSARRVGDFYAGIQRDWRAGGKWRKYGKTKHTHHPVDDAKRVAESLQGFCKEFGIALA